MRRFILATVVASLAAAPVAHARPGDLDRSFSRDGRLAFDPYKQGGTVVALSLRDGLRPVLAVQAARNGTAAPTWVELGAGGRITRRTLLASPAYYFSHGFGGFALAANWTEHVRQVIRAGAASGLTLTFDAVSELDAFGVDGRGRIVVGGTRDVRQSAAGSTLWRFLPDGRPDLTFGGDGTVELPHLRAVWGLVVERDGRIFAVEPRRLVALDAAGRPLPGFTQTGLKWPNGRYTQPRIDGFARGRDGTLLVLGSNAGYARHFVARLRPNGKLDRRFGRRGFFLGHPSFKYEVELDAITTDRRGRVLLGGSSFARDEPSATLYRLTARGRLDRTFARRGYKAFRLGTPRGIDISRSTIGAIAVDRRGRIVVAGNVYDSDFEYREDIGNPYPAIARLQG